MIQLFLEKGYKLVEFTEIADIYVVNTCTVTNMSDKKSRQMLRKVKEKNKNSIIVAVGCYAQVAKKELEQIEEIDIVLGNDEKKDIIKYIEDYNGKKISKVSQIECVQNFLDFGQVLHLETTRAVIKIQDGCNNFCTYCIIPYARGRIRSRDKESILKEVQEIVNIGVKEVVLTGIHIASYGKENDSGYYLIDLIEELNKIDGLKRIRLGSLEPNIITEEFVNRLKNVNKICDHFHLSLQSGCDETLKRMNRKYNVYDFKNGVDLLRKKFNKVNLTTDIIVGFPGETEKEFLKTYEFLKNIKFFKMHVFKYSKRSGTLAAGMKEQVNDVIKEERSKKLIELSNKNEKNILEEYIGKNVDVLIELKKDNFWIGHTKNYMVVKVFSKNNLENLIVEVKIENIENVELVGHIVN